MDIHEYQAKDILARFGVPVPRGGLAWSQEQAAYRARDLDAIMVGINPLVITGAGDLVALDAKMSFDTYALYRRPEVAELRNRSQEDPRESTAGDHGVAYVGLTGDIGCIINGAGPAMATMDMIKLAGGGSLPIFWISAAGPVRNGWCGRSAPCCPTPMSA